MEDSQTQQTGLRNSPVVGLKKRAACDECRAKKLKCTGEQPSCSRCVRENIACNYSPQAQMGRPKKRQREDDEVARENSNTTNTSSTTSGSGSGRHHSNYTAFGNEFAFPGTATGTDNSAYPWMPDTWDFASNSLIPTEAALPALTPDSSSNSPPTLNLPPELSNPPSHSHSMPNTSTQFLLDPSLGTNLGMPPSPFPPCACLSTLYLTLNNLQNMDPSFPFPFALHPLREAISTASDVLACQQCPERFISAIQNTQLVGTLLVSIAERFSKVLSAITTEAQRAEEAGENKKFRLADLNTSTSHLHFAGLGCAAAFNIDLSPAEWRSMTKKVVRAEVYGPPEGNGCCAYYIGIVDQMERRQEYFHDREMPADFPKCPKTGVPMGGKYIPKEEHLCLKMVGYARTLVEGFDWS